MAEHKHGGLGQLSATAICGNDITSSCLYVSALALLYSGKWAPLALLLVAAVLFLFRGIYAEVVGALPLNGGAYNALLNTTSKFRASIAACLTVLSYMATAVISASEAMHYVHSLWNGLPVLAATVVLLAIFMCLSIVGITESAIVAIIIFVTHLAALCLLIVVGCIYIAGNGTEVLTANLRTHTEGNLMLALFFGFSAAMLGISGFESSANFVEEQAEGVFPKTLRNMWIAVAIFNPGMALLALALIPISQVPEHQEALLARLADVSGGRWLSLVISVDAALVLSGAVLTSFVGVNGLVRRMTLDRCLPQFLLKTNRRGTTYRIIILFFLLSVSILFITRGELAALAGVYTIAFLSVMALFALGNILLKVKRAGLPRPSRASWPAVFLGAASVLAALVGNAVMNPPYLRVFLEYSVPAVLVVSVMLWRIDLLKGILYIVRASVESLTRIFDSLARIIRKKINSITAQQVAFFTRGDHLENLNKVMVYVQKNEHSKRIKVVHVMKEGGKIPPRLESDLKFLDEAYPDLDIEFVAVEGKFGPELIQTLSREWRIPTNMMFIGSPGEHLIYGIAELGGVRLIV